MNIAGIAVSSPLSILQHIALIDKRKASGKHSLCGVYQRPKKNARLNRSAAQRPAYPTPRYLTIRNAAKQQAILARPPNHDADGVLSATLFCVHRNDNSGAELTPTVCLCWRTPRHQKLLQRNAASVLRTPNRNQNPGGWIPQKCSCSRFFL